MHRQYSQRMLPNESQHVKYNYSHCIGFYNNEDIYFMNFGPDISDGNPFFQHFCLSGNELLHSPCTFPIFLWNKSKMIFGCPPINKINKSIKLINLMYHKIHILCCVLLIDLGISRIPKEWFIWAIWSTKRNDIIYNWNSNFKSIKLFFELCMSLEFEYVYLLQDAYLYTESDRFDELPWIICSCLILKTSKMEKISFRHFR